MRGADLSAAVSILGGVRVDDLDAPPGRCGELSVQGGLISLILPSTAIWGEDDPGIAVHHSEEVPGPAVGDKVAVATVADRRRPVATERADKPRRLLGVAMRTAEVDRRPEAVLLRADGRHEIGP